MIASDTNLYFMRECSKPLIDFREFFLFPNISHVSTMNQNISIRNNLSHFMFPIMRVRQDYKSDVLFFIYFLHHFNVIFQL